MAENDSEPKLLIIDGADCAIEVVDPNHTHNRFDLDLFR